MTRDDDEEAYSFEEQLRIGNKDESRLDDCFKKWYTIMFATREQQRMGIDRIWQKKATPRKVSVEYKADYTASRTGNAFIEIVSVDITDTPGWAYTSLAQLLVYYIPPKDVAYVLPMTEIKTKVCDWKIEYKLSPPVPNVGRNGERYNAFGLLLPVFVLEHYCNAKKIIVSKAKLVTKEW